MDLNKYAEMVSGCDFCEIYESSEEKGIQTVKSTYEISALHMKYKYYVTHVYDPKASCMVFHLDYSRRSDLDDTVGYWYVDPKSRNSCRVYYSCECKLRGWVPGPVYNMMTKEAVKKVCVHTCTSTRHHSHKHTHLKPYSHMHYAFMFTGDDVGRARVAQGVSERGLQV